MDDFLDQLVGLADDLEKSASLHPKRDAVPGKPTVKATPGQEELLRLAKVALSNLKGSPDYYKVRRADGVQTSSSGKVTRDDALRAARELGVDFRYTDFDQETFRKGIEAEFNRNSAFSREYSPEKASV